MVRRPHATALMVAVAAAGMALAGYSVWPRGAPARRAAGAGQDFAVGAPTWQVYPARHRTVPGPVSGELLDGTRFDLRSWRGRVVVVNFWASWCAPGRAEAKDLNSVYEATKPQGVEFLGVDILDDRSRAQAFMDAFAVPYPSLFDPAGRVALAFQGVNPSAIPTTVIVDRSGQVAAVFRKRVTAIELETVLRDVVAEPAAEAVAAGG